MFAKMLAQALPTAASFMERSVTLLIKLIGVYFISKPTAFNVIVLFNP